MKDFVAGSAFIHQKRDEKDRPHLWVIISDPQQDPNSVVIVNLTSFDEEKDPSCVLEFGEHSFVRKKTCIRYLSARVTNIPNLIEGEKRQIFWRKEDASKSLIAKLRKGAMQSRFTVNNIRKILRQQGLV